MTLPNTAPNTHLSLDTACELLANAERRTVLWYFIDQKTDTAELDELVEHIHEEVDAVTSSDRARLSLTHMHIPKLAEHDVVEYDERSETMRYRDGRRVEALLEAVAIDE
jgi:hypothetical protein